MCTTTLSSIDLSRKTIYGGFLKWWYPTTMVFPTKNDHFGVFWGYHHFRKPPYIYIYALGCYPNLDFAYRGSHAQPSLDTMGKSANDVWMMKVELP